MSVDKLVDSTQLDADLTSVANAIRTKGGTSAQLAFPADFVSAIEAIPTGGGHDEDYTNLIQGTIVNLSDDSATSVSPNLLKNRTSLQSVDLPEATDLGADCFSGCSGLTSVRLPKLQTANGSVLLNTRIVTLVLPSITTVKGSNTFKGITTLTHADFGPNLGGILNQNALYGDSALTTIIFRTSSGIVSLQNINSLTSTPFASGGAGGTIYIPKALYDHLGDGTALDYKAATNWSTINGYGTITWAAIEGSQYENYYADGTPIPTT